MVASKVGPGTPLRTLMAAYLHQDWDVEYSDVWAAVADFVDHAPQCMIAAAHSELRDLIAQDLSAAAIEVALAHYSCAYYPPGDGYTLDGWLRELERRLQVALGGS